MHKAAELIRLLADWRRLSEGERGAILEGDWSGVADHQARKSQLQQQITLVFDQSHPVPTDRECPSDASQQELDALVREVIALEIRNRDLVAEQLQHHQPESQRLAQTVRHLQGVRRAYGPSRGPCWQSYS
jgi:hypothetical protein